MSARDLHHDATGIAESAHAVAVDTIGTLGGRGAGTESENVVRKARWSNDLPVVRAGIRIETETPSATRTHTDQPVLAAMLVKVAVHHDVVSDHVRGHHRAGETVLETGAGTEAAVLRALIDTYQVDQLRRLLRARTTKTRHADVLATTMMI